MKRFLWGGLTALAGASVIALLTALSIAKAGLVPINPWMIQRTSGAPGRDGSTQ